ncbi:MAG: ZIP family metal transporter [Leptotrichiaceae bacterium]|nr:ZIP family metal transporter [Leptotrichiaceae bacterium]MBP9629595.1 ZIP family metal transporter [Leptotrichiaceae bacterium]
MVSFFYNLSPIIQALIGTLFTWGLTALGASLVFFFKTINKKMLNAMLGFAAGVMVAASFWSLLNPAIILSEELGHISWITVSIGFLSGGFFLFLIDKLLPHLHLGLKTDNAEGIKTSWQRSLLLVLSITLHNIPEGLAVGVAFGAAAFGIPGASVASAVALAIGIGLQNFPEGAAVSIPLRREGFTRKKAFFYGQASGIVEPIAGVLGVIAVVSMRNFLPFALAFAAGAMIFVVVEELIPEAQLNEGENGINKSADIATIGFMIGFAIMMILDVALG